MRHRFLSLTLLSLCLAVACTAQTQSASQKAIAAADHAWNMAAVAKDLDKFMESVSADGSVYPPNAPIATGQTAIRELFKGFFAIPGVKLSWQATSVEVAASGELAYTSGAYTMSFDGPNGTTATDTGKYVTVWRHEKDGKWRAVRDIFNSDLPLSK